MHFDKDVLDMFLKLMGNVHLIPTDPNFPEAADRCKRAINQLNAAIKETDAGK